MIAGQSIDAGTVTVRNDETYLYVTVYSKAGFQDVQENIKMWIGTKLPNKRPPAGKFPYKIYETSDTGKFRIELSTLEGWDDEAGCEQDFYIIVHADVLTIAGDPNSGETAFGGCEEGAGKAWWYYMEYTTQCCDEEVCMDAFAKKGNEAHSHCINYTDNNGKQYLAWSNQIDFGLFQGSTRQITLWANVDQCNPYDDSDRIAVGYVNISTFSEGEGDGMKLYANIKYVIYDRYIDRCHLIEVNSYVGLDKSPIDSNGNLIISDTNKFYHKELGGVSEYTFERLSWPGKNTYKAWDTYIIAHAKVCEIK